MERERTPIHWTDDREALLRRVSAPARLLVACDFDGTLAPIVPTPDEAVLGPGAADALCRLAASSGVRLAIVSGRSISDLAGRVPVEPALLVGNHGLEMRGLGLDGERTAAAAHREALAATMVEVGSVLEGIPGVLVENKGLTGSVHYRNVAPNDFPTIAGALTGMLEGQGVFELHHGKMVWEIRPRLGWHKGSAVRQILQRLGQPDTAAVYLGDDTTDESAFESLPNAITVHVGSSLRTAARWSADDPADVVAFLDWLVAARGHRR